MELPDRMPERAKSKAVGAMHHFAFLSAAAMIALTFERPEDARMHARKARRYWAMTCEREAKEA